MAADRFPYQDLSRPVAERVTDLIGRMTLEEKVAQLHEQPNVEIVIRDGKCTSESLDRVFRGLSYGTISGPFGESMTSITIINRDAQEYARTKTRLGIPFLTVNETLHGGLFVGATMFPQTIAQGSTWNPELIGKMAAAIAQEVSATGVAQALAPMVTLARDPRWGRVEECFGECPYLVSRFGVAYAQAMQGGDPSVQLEPNKLLCMSKVMAAYCVPRSGINIASASLGERELRSVFLPAHEALVKEAHIASVMPSYNCIDGIPAHANRWLLTKVLREEWGFDGYTYSDWGGVDFNQWLHRIAPTNEAAAALAIKAGVDLEAPQSACYRHLGELVKSGAVTTDVIHVALERVLTAKFRAGLFDGKRPAIDVSELPKFIHTPEHVALARKVAEESVILLKNQNGLLPLDRTRLKSIAVIGPNADQVQFGDYSPTKDNSKGVTVLAAMREFAGNDGPSIHYSRGCHWVGSDRNGFAEAVEVTQKCDVAVVVVGDTSMNIGGGVGGVTDREIGQLATVGEGYDRSELTIPGMQEDLIRALHATGKPIVVVLVNGRPFSVPWIKGNVPAIIEAFYPGEQGGPAIVDILFGKICPSGRLPVSIAQSPGHLPTTYDFEPADRGFYKVRGTPEKPGRDYVFSSPDPLWPFGYGLSYASFEYSDLRIETPKVGPTGDVRFRFSLRNTSAREGSEVAQVYFRPSFSSVVVPNRRLIRFAKERLAAGETREIAATIRAQELAIWNAEMKRVVEPGRFELMIGASAEDIKLTGSFDVSD